MILNIWRAVFHEVRHFVQHQIPLAEIHFFAEGSIEQMARISPEAGKVVRCQLSHYSHFGAKAYAREVDAIAIGTLGVIRLAHSCKSNGNDEFDYEAVRRILLMHSDQISEEQEVLRCYHA